MKHGYGDDIGQPTLTATTYIFENYDIYLLNLIRQFFTTLRRIDDTRSSSAIETKPSTKAVEGT